MKKIILAALLVCISLQSYSQEEKTQPKKHEIKLNALMTLFGVPEISYEYLLNEESSMGLSVLFSLEDNYQLDFALTPYYRFFFGKKPASGFFVEGFGMLNIGDADSYDGGSSQPNETDVALGISIGTKLLTKSGFIFEIYGGAGRNLFNDNSFDAVPRFGISFGKRF